MQHADLPRTPVPTVSRRGPVDLLWNVVYKGKILIIEHAAAQESRITGLIKMGYLDATPKLSSQEARARCQAELEQCYDQLAAISRRAWLACHEEAQRLFADAEWRRRQLVESDYHVSEAGRHLVLEWEHARQEGVS